MPITHFATNLQQSMNWFHKEHQMDPRFHDTISEDLDDHNNYHYTTATNSQQQQHYNLYNNHQPTAIQINNYNNKEPMFEKPLTPSDVGKLNRLVIPKQHAEKYFPLNGSNFINSSNNNDSPPSSGTLLGFEDESGKSWRFRYSYWNSSQSYVLTKGWSRYVKEKRLNAGDVVFFERDLVSPDRLFIGWRRRAGGGGGGSSGSRVAAVQDGVRSSYGNGHVMRGGYVGQDTSICSSSGADGVVGFGISPPYRSDHASSFHTGTSAMQSHKQTPGSGTNNSNMRNKRLFRLFGVNLECQPDDYSQSQTTSSESSSLSSQQQQQQQGPSSSSSVYGGNYFDYAAGSNGNGYHHHQSHYHHHHQMDINYPQGVNNQMGNRLDS